MFFSEALVEEGIEDGATAAARESRELGLGIAWRGKVEEGCPGSPRASPHEGQLREEANTHAQVWLGLD